MVGKLPPAFLPTAYWRPSREIQERSKHKNMLHLYRARRDMPEQEGVVSGYALARRDGIAVSA
jgi:hypothetical protein